MDEPGLECIHSVFTNVVRWTTAWRYHAPFFFELRGMNYFESSRCSVLSMMGETILVKYALFSFLDTISTGAYDNGVPDGFSFAMGVYHSASRGVLCVSSGLPV